MSQPESKLDTVLHSEEAIARQARERMVQYCPEWTHKQNASDPGMALIQLFSWMSHEMVSRLNQVPEKNHRQFLELLALQLKPASSARTEVTFYLSTDLPIDPNDKFDQTQAFVPQGTEVTTLYTEDEEQEVIFTTDHNLTIRRPPLLKYLLREDDNKNYIREEGKLVGKSVEVFRQTKQFGGTFYLGFQAEAKQSLAGYILRLRFKCETREGAGINPEDPPLVWECLLGIEGEEEKWHRLPLSERRGERDTTGGLNNEVGSLVLYLPLAMKPDMIEGRYGYWLRCRHEQQHVAQGQFNVSPKIENIQAFSVGATVEATHVVFVKNEELGISHGEAKQTFFLAHHPILEPNRNGKETVEVQEWEHNELTFVPWTRVKYFAESGKDDRHFTLDTATSEVQFGPAIRQTDGSVKQYGRIPERAHKIRFSQYCRGGGSEGNLPRGELQVLKTTLPYIREVVNRAPATGGRAQESLQEAKKRAREEIRAQERAVTAADYENLVLAASRKIRRVKCLTPRDDKNLPAGQIRLLVVPEVTDMVREKYWRALRVDSSLQYTIREHLADYQLPTMSPQISDPFYVGIQVTCKIVPAERSMSSPEMLKSNINDALTQFLTPLPLNEESSQGWPFGGTLYKGELMRLVEQVPGVRYVNSLNLSRTPDEVNLLDFFDQQEASPKQEQNESPDASRAEDDAANTKREDQLVTLINDWVIEIPIDGLICSLEHQIEIVDV